ncbi:MAG: helix-turn-helix domain-containing protein [Chthoniobacterales bacterium]
MEGLGEKFQKARLARNLTLDEAARMTKIRPQKLAELEAEDFSRFPSLAYAKGFLLIYGKFLNVDVSPYLEAFETSETMTVDGYSYLQDNPVPPPRRTEVVRRREPSAQRSSLMPLVIGVLVLIVGFWVLKTVMDLRRLKPVEQRATGNAPLAVATASPLPTVADAPIVAPRALPADSTPAPTAVAVTTATPEATAVAMATEMPSVTPLPTVAQATPPPVPPSDVTEGEVRRAEPVHAEDLAKAKTALAAMSPSPTPAATVFDIRPLRKTFVRITIDTDKGRSSFERWVDVNAPVQLRGKRIAVKVLDPADVEIRKNGKLVARGDSDVRLE